VRRRFFVDKFASGRAVMQGEAAHHLGRVLRAQPGQLYELSDGQHVCLARIENVSRNEVEFAIVDELPAHSPKLDAVLLLSIVKFDAFEWALEKATELGVGRIVPLAAARSEKALLTAAAKRSERWKKVLLEASQQSRRLQVPALSQLANPGAAFSSYRDGLRIMLSERPDAPSLRTVLEGPSGPKVTLAIGPEGGWTDSEIEAARAAQFSEASLGNLILRTETAVVAALAAVQFALGE
jgi:16S rRNA (uracil1498-N3)-methyltransferase